MADPTLEIEAKFLVPDLRAIRERLLRMKAMNIQEAILELNWRFDTSDQRLNKSGEVLRIRQDRKLRMTYKKKLDTIEERLEIEFEVSDALKSKDFLVALGFDQIMIYEKYREIYQLEGSTVMLDQLPYGNFVEVEASSLEAVESESEQLGLLWARRSSESYTELFLQLCKLRGLDIQDATFETFMIIPPLRPPELGIQFGTDASPL